MSQTALHSCVRRCSFLVFYFHDVCIVFFFISSLYYFYIGERCLPRTSWGILSTTIFMESMYIWCFVFELRADYEQLGNILEELKFDPHESELALFNVVQWRL